MTQVDEWTPLVLEKLSITLGDEAPKLIALLKDTGAILSGGFVLNSVAKYYIMGSGHAPDLDIYVPLANMPRFIASLANDTLKLKMFVDPFDATIYCRSFLRKNGIRRVYTFLTTNDKSVDVMAVRTKKTVQDVCSNFDLTFSRSGLMAHMSLPRIPTIFVKRRVIYRANILIRLYRVMHSSKTVFVNTSSADLRSSMIHQRLL